MGIASSKCENAALMSDNTILILNGLGSADLVDPSIQQIQSACSSLCDELDIELDFRQAGNESELCRWLAEDGEKFRAVVVNPVRSFADYEKYRSAIAALAEQGKPIAEVHTDNIFRETLTAAKPLSDIAGNIAFICGLGLRGYLLAIRAVSA